MAIVRYIYLIRLDLYYEELSIEILSCEFVVFIFRVIVIEKVFMFEQKIHAQERGGGGMATDYSLRVSHISILTKPHA